MPTPSEKEQDNRVSILINGKVHSAWSRYQIDSDFLIPADAWYFRRVLRVVSPFR